MKSKAVILYSTVDGHTLKICNHIAAQLEENGCNVNVNEISTFNKPLLDYNTVIIGASIRYGKHNKKWIDQKNGVPVKHYMYHPFSGKTHQYGFNRTVEIK